MGTDMGTDIGTDGLFSENIIFDKARTLKLLLLKAYAQKVNLSLRVRSHRFSCIMYSHNIDHSNFLTIYSCIQWIVYIGL